MLAAVSAGTDQSLIVEVGVMGRDALREYVRGSLWVLPTLSVLAALAAGAVLSSVSVGPRSPLAFQGTPDDARTLLLGITGTMITIIALLLGLAVVALHRLHDRVDLDRVQQVVCEEHQQAEADEQQHDRAADREPGKGGGAVAARDADRVEPGRAVGEGRHERAEHDLIRPVPQEVAQQPRRELGGGQLKRHHG